MNRIYVKLLSSPALAALAGLVLGGCKTQPTSGADPTVATDPTSTATPSPSPATSSRAAPTSRVLTVPAASPPATALVVFLHGVGADAASFRSIADAFRSDLPHAELVVPDGFEPFDQARTGRQWFSLANVDASNRAPRLKKGAEAVSAWIDAELDQRKLGRERVVVVGFSQGAMVGGWLAVHRSPAPAAVVMFSGLVADEATPLAGSVATPVFMAHGTADTRVPFAALEPGAAALRAWGAKVTTRVYPGLAHSITAEELAEASAFVRAAIPK